MAQGLTPKGRSDAPPCAWQDSTPREGQACVPLSMGTGVDPLRWAFGHGRTASQRSAEALMAPTETCLDSPDPLRILTRPPSTWRSNFF